jgi:hypothetical protein
MADDLMAGLALGQLVGIYLHGGGGCRFQTRGDGWLVMPYDKWWDLCRMTEKQARRAVGILVDKGILDKEIHQVGGTPMIHLRININNFERIQSEFLEKEI